MDKSETKTCMYVVKPDLHLCQELVIKSHFHRQNGRSSWPLHFLQCDHTPPYKVTNPLPLMCPLLSLQSDHSSPSKVTTPFPPKWTLLILQSDHSLSSIVTTPHPPLSEMDNFFLWTIYVDPRTSNQTKFHCPIFKISVKISIWNCFHHLLLNWIL
jgi:hypothetical protein